MKNFVIFSLILLSILFLTSCTTFELVGEAMSLMGSELRYYKACTDREQEKISQNDFSKEEEIFLSAIEQIRKNTDKILCNRLASLGRKLKTLEELAQSDSQKTKDNETLSAYYATSQQCLTLFDDKIYRISNELKEKNDSLSLLKNQLAKLGNDFNVQINLVAKQQEKLKQAEETINMLVLALDYAIEVGGTKKYTASEIRAKVAEKFPRLACFLIQT